MGLREDWTSERSSVMEAKQSMHNQRTKEEGCLGSLFYVLDSELGGSGIQFFSELTPRPEGSIKLNARAHVGKHQHTQELE